MCTVNPFELPQTGLFVLYFSSMLFRLPVLYCSILKVDSTSRFPAIAFGFVSCLKFFVLDVKLFYCFSVEVAVFFKITYF
jgi:hypothetical protein